MNKRIQLPLYEDKTILPTEKNHISFSEISIWAQCAFRHKLLYIEDLPGDPPNEHTSFGNVLHDAMEIFMLEHKNPSYNHIKTIETAKQNLEKVFKEIEFIDDGSWSKGLEEILSETPEWFNTTFPGWKSIGAEFQLFETIPGHTNKYFKAYIDGFIKCPKQSKKKKKNQPVEETQYWVIDFKGSSFGWSKKNKMDSIKKMQLVLYKHFLSKKLNIDPKQIKCGFVICKRDVKPGNHLELFEVSCGEKTTAKTLDLVDTMLVAMQKGFFKKDRNSCTYCKFKNGNPCI